MLKQLKITLIAITVLSSLCAISCRKDAASFGEGFITVGGKKIRVQLARTPAQMRHGLKYRRHLPDDEGMFFVYPHPVQNAFWMKDTHLPLSIAFINREGQILSIQKMEPNNDSKYYRSSLPFQYALEMNQGWFERNDVRIGDRIVLDNLLSR